MRWKTTLSPGEESVELSSETSKQEMLLEKRAPRLAATDTGIIESNEEAARASRLKSSSSAFLNKPFNVLIQEFKTSSLLDDRKVSCQSPNNCVKWGEKYADSSVKSESIRSHPRSQIYLMDRNLDQGVAMPVLWPLQKGALLGWIHLYLLKQLLE